MYIENINEPKDVKELSIPQLGECESFSVN